MPPVLKRNPQTKQELLLHDIVQAIAGVGAPSPAGLATESTLLLVLNAIVASDQDIEILLVRDTGDSDKVLQQITNYETGTPVITYKDVNGVTVTPVGPLEYLDPSAVLNLMLTELLDQGLTLDSIQTELLAHGVLLTSIDADTNAIKIATDGTNTKLANATATDGTATNNIGFLMLGSDGVNDQSILTDTTGAIQLPVVTRTAAALRVGAGVANKVGAGARSASFYNTGDVDSTVAGDTLAPGESITFDAGGQRDVLGDVNYVTGAATGGLLITTVV